MLDNSPAPRDVLTGLFTSTLRPESDDNQLGLLQTFHRKVIERLFPLSVSSVGGSSMSDNQTSPVKLPSLQQSIKQSAIDANQVHIFLSRYESLTSYFPFVVLPSGWTVRTMLQNHPFLALGILSAVRKLKADIECCIYLFPFTVLSILINTKLLRRVLHQNINLQKQDNRNSPIRYLE
jgi:hypothetical protein